LDEFQRRCIECHCKPYGQFRQWATQVLRGVRYQGLKDAPTTKVYFAKVQNKLHFAIHGHTAAELIIQRADSTKDRMGLTSWENSPDGKILRTDVSIAKNYLTKDELNSLGRIVNAYLELAEERALRKIPMVCSSLKFLENFRKRMASCTTTSRPLARPCGFVKGTRQRDVCSSFIARVQGFSSSPVSARSARKAV